MGRGNWDEQHWKELEVKYKDWLYGLRVNKHYSYPKCKRIMEVDVGIRTLTKWCKRWGFQIQTPRKGTYPQGKENASTTSSHITEELLRIYYEKLLIKWDDIAKIFGVCHNTIWKKRKKYDIKSRPKKGQIQRKIRNYKGSNNPAWNPDREQVVAPYTEMFYNESYREMIIRQQDYICPLCNKDSDEIFDLHHIDFGKLNDDRYNLIFLHHSCHGKVKDIPGDIEKMQEINNKICMSILAA